MNHISIGVAMGGAPIQGRAPSVDKVSAPTWTTAPTIALAGRVVTVARGTAEGAPSPSYAVAATLDGTAVSMTGAGPWSFEVPSATGARAFAAVVTARNGVAPPATATLALDVPADQSAPVPVVSLMRSELVVTITASATGAPEPVLTLDALTLDGADVRAQSTGIGPWSYAVPPAATAQTVAAVVQATNVVGAARAGADVSVPAVLFAPVISGVPTVSGSTVVGETLAATAAPVAGTPAPTCTWAWLRDGTPIPGATDAAYTLVEADLGATVTARQIETNVVGSASASSVATAAVEHPAAPAAVSLLWRAEDMPAEGTTLTAGQTVDFYAGDDEGEPVFAPFTVAAGTTVEFPVSASGERLVRFPAAMGQIVSASNDGTATVALLGTAPGEISAVLWDDGTPVASDAVDVSGSASAFFQAAFITNAVAALGRLQDADATDFDMSLDLSAVAGDVAAFTIGGSLTRTPETVIPFKGLSLANVAARVEPDGAVTLVISETDPARIVLAEQFDADDLAGLLADSPAASEPPTFATSFDAAVRAAGAVVGVETTTDLTALVTGGVAPLTYSADMGDVAAGVWTWTPSDAAETDITITATDARGVTATSSALDFAPSAASVAPVFETPPAISGDLTAGSLATFFEGVATGEPAPTLTGVLTLDGADVTADMTGLDYVIPAETAIGAALAWTVTAANAGGSVVASVSATVLPAISSAASLASLLPASIAVGEAVSPSIPASDGPNLCTAANNIGMDADTTYVSYVSGDDGYIEFTSTSTASNNNDVVDIGSAGLVPGDVIVVENVGTTPYVFRWRTTTTTTTVEFMSVGEVAVATIPADATRVRIQVLQTGVCRVRVRKRTQAVLGADIDLAACFAGGTGARTVEIAGLPAGWSASSGVISGASAASVGAGGDYEISVTATDEAGAQLELTHILQVTEPFEVLSVGLANENGSEIYRVGDTVRLLIDWRGWPGPYPGSTGLHPQWRRTAQDQTNAFMRVDASGNDATVTIREGTTELRVGARFQLDADTQSPLVSATPVAVLPPLATAAPVVTVPTSATVDGYEVTIDPGAASGSPEPTSAVVSILVDGVELLEQEDETPEWTTVETWISTDAARDNDPETVQGLYGGFAFAGPNHWGNWALDGAGSSIETRYETSGALLRLRTITTNALDAPDYTPIGAPHITFGRHYNLVSNANPFGSYLDSASITEWKARARYTVNSASAGARVWPAIQLYGWRQDNASAGSSDFSGTLDLDLQIRYVNDPTGYLGTVAYTVAIDGRNWRVNVGNIFSKAKIYTFAPPEGEDFHEFEDLDLRPIIADVLARENTRLGTSFTGFRFAGCQFWVEPLHGTTDVVVDRVGMRLNGVSYGEY